MNKTQEEFLDEPIFDYGPGQSPPIASKNIPTATHVAIDERAEEGVLEFNSLASRADVPTFVTVPPWGELVIEERVAALATNPHFSCLGHDHGDYHFWSNRAGERTVTRDFEEKWILELAPLAFWAAWSGTGDFQQRKIMDALIQLAHSTGKFKLQC